MAISFTEIRAYLDADGIRYFISPDQPVLFLGMTGLTGSFRILIHLDVEGQFLQFRTLGFGSCPPGHPHQPALTRVLSEVNARRRFVKFAWDASDGEVIAYGDHWIMDGTITHAQFHQMFGNFMSVVDLDNRRIATVIGEGTDPGELEPPDLPPPDLRV